jgi:hypothetical protein
MRARVAVAGLAVVVFAAGVAVGTWVIADDGGTAGDGGDADGGPATATGDGSDAGPAPTPYVAPSPPMEEVPRGDPERGTRPGSPLDDLPPGVTELTDVGQRPDWSPDGREIVFLDDSPLGQVWSVDVSTGATTELTGGFENRGFSRVAHLADGDLLLCGPTSGPAPTGERPEAGRFTGVLSVLRAPFDAPPEPLGVPCWEGIATARESMRIAWNRSDVDYTDPDLVDRVVNGITEVWTGEVRDVDGRATVVNPRKVLDREAFGALGVFEVQAFRPPEEDELLLTAYAYQGGEVLGLGLDDGVVRNYSNSSAYEEAEGVDPGGDAVYVERDTAYDGLTPRCARHLAAGPGRPGLGADHVLQPPRALLRVEPERLPRRAHARVPAVDRRRRRGAGRRHPAARPRRLARTAGRQRSVFSQTETCDVLSPVNGERSQPAHRSPVPMASSSAAPSPASSASTSTVGPRTSASNIEPALSS